MISAYASEEWSEDLDTVSVKKGDKREQRPFEEVIPESSVKEDAKQHSFDVV